MVEKSEIKHIADIARLELSDAELEKYTKDIGSILEAFQQIGKVNTDSVEPSFHPISIKNAMREDRPKPSLSAKRALSNAKHTEKNMFKGPRAV